MPHSFLNPIQYLCCHRLSWDMFVDVGSWFVLFQLMPPPYVLTLLQLVSSHYRVSACIWNLG